MEKHSLGPNGGLVYCMEYLYDHIDWLHERIEKLQSNYLIFDCPGQV
jgi:GPN-loop GTPase